FAHIVIQAADQGRRQLVPGYIVENHRTERLRGGNRRGFGGQVDRGHTKPAVAEHLFQVTVVLGAGAEQQHVFHRRSAHPGGSLVILGNRVFTRGVWRKGRV